MVRHFQYNVEVFFKEKFFIWKNKIFFLYLGFLSQTLKNDRTVVEGEGISLTPLYHFDPLHENYSVDYRRKLNFVRSKWFGSNWEPLVSELKLLTTKLRALYVLVFKNGFSHVSCRLYGVNIRQSLIEAVNRAIWVS